MWETLAHRRGAGDNDDVQEVPTLAALVFIVTVIGFSLLMFCISYTFGHLITTLCMVESPSATTYVPINTVEPQDEPPAYSEDGTPKPVDPETNMLQTQPVTTSLRATTAHLRARAGFWSLFRGLGVYIVWNGLRGFITGILSAASRNPLALAIAAIIAEVAMANVHMTWIHVVISEPSPYRWWQRFPRPALRAWRKIAPAVAIWATASQVVTIFPMVLAGSWGTLRRMRDPEFNPGMKDAYASAGQLFFAAFLTIVMFVTIQIPATVAMVRVAASMLPEEDETIVPFDRSFGGLTTPEIIGGQGKIGIVEAWRSFNGQCRRRLLRLILKVAGLVMAVWTLFTIVAVLEAHLLFGDSFGGMMKGMHRISHRD